MRRKLTVRAYAWLGLYAGTALWVNLCYVFAYDAPTVMWVHAHRTIVFDVVSGVAALLCKFITSLHLAL